MLDDLNMDRRAWLGHALALVGATAAAGFSPEALAKAAKSPKRFLDAARFKTLTSLADTIIPATDTPGALAVKVPALIDAMMRNWASAKTQTEMTAAIDAIDRMAMAADKKTFAAIAPARRKALLIEHDKAALRNVPRKDKLTGLAALMGAPSVADPGYYRLKSLVVSLYYNSEIAMTQELVFEPVPGEWVPSLKITPGMRPFSGGGGIGG